MLSQIFSGHRNQGSGGVYYVTGSNHEEVREKAHELKNEIDFMRSPYMVERIEPNGDLYVEIKYYGLD